MTESKSFAHNAAVARRRANEVGGGWPALVERAIAKNNEELVLSCIGTLVEIQTTPLTPGRNPK